MRVVILEPLSISANILEKYVNKLEIKGHEVISYNNRIENEDEIISRSKKADVLVLTNIPITDKIIKSCSNLKMISVAFTGVDHIDLDACKKNNITVCNSSGYANQSVAELTFGFIISLMRNIKDCDSATRNGKTRLGLIGNEISNKNLGIIGTGEIGLKVAKLGKAFGCNLLGFDKVKRAEGKRIGIKYMDLKSLLRKSDIVSIHLPLTDKTEGLINQNKLKLMKKSSILINVARGPIVDTKALFNVLREKNIRGAGIDVFDKEPPLTEDDPLVDLSNVILTPHIGFATQEAFNKRADIVFENIKKWEEGNPQNVMV